jgi:hypothetical protein
MPSVYEVRLVGPASLTLGGVVYQRGQWRRVSAALYRRLLAYGFDGRERVVIGKGVMPRVLDISDNGKDDVPAESPGPGPGPSESPGPGPGPSESPGPGPGPSESPGPGPGPSESPGPGPGPSESPGPASLGARGVQYSESDLAAMNRSDLIKIAPSTAGLTRMSKTDIMALILASQETTP